MVDAVCCATLVSNRAPLSGVKVRNRRRNVPLPPAGVAALLQDAEDAPRQAVTRLEAEVCRFEPHSDAPHTFRMPRSCLQLPKITSCVGC